MRCHASMAKFACKCKTNFFELVNSSWLLVGNQTFVKFSKVSIPFIGISIHLIILLLIRKWWFVIFLRGLIQYLSLIWRNSGWCANLSTRSRSSFCCSRWSVLQRSLLAARNFLLLLFLLLSKIEGLCILDLLVQDCFKICTCWHNCWISSLAAWIWLLRRPMLLCLWAAGWSGSPPIWATKSSKLSVLNAFRIFWDGVSPPWGEGPLSGCWNNKAISAAIAAISGIAAIFDVRFGSKTGCFLVDPSALPPPFPGFGLAPPGELPEGPPPSVDAIAARLPTVTIRPAGMSCASIKLFTWIIWKAVRWGNLVSTSVKAALFCSNDVPSGSRTTSWFDFCWLFVLLVALTGCCPGRGNPLPLPAGASINWSSSTSMDDKSWACCSITTSVVFANTADDLQLKSSLLTLQVQRTSVNHGGQGI